MRPRLTYANVISTLIVAMLLAGGTAFAAKQLAKKSVGTKQLKANAVTTAKIKKAAVTTAKLKDGLVDGTKILDGSVTAPDFTPGGTPFSQVVTKLNSTAQVPFISGNAYPFGNATYTQNAGEDNQFFVSMKVTFAATCEAPRDAQAYLMIDPAHPFPEIEITDIAGVGVAFDEGTGAVTRTVQFGGTAGIGPMTRFAPASAKQHTFAIGLAGTSCKTGSGISADGATIEIAGIK